MVVQRLRLGGVEAGVEDQDAVGEDGEEGGEPDETGVDPETGAGDEPFACVSRRLTLG